MAEDQNGPQNIEFITPVAKAKVELKPWMSGHDDDAVRKALMGGYKTSIKSKQAGRAQPKDYQKAASGDVENQAVEADQTVEVDATATLRADEARIKVMVVSVNGDASDVLKSVYDLPSPDKYAILDKIKEILKSVLGDPKPDNPADPQDSPAAREKKS